MLMTASKPWPAELGSLREVAEIATEEMRDAGALSLPAQKITWPQKLRDITPQIVDQVVLEAQFLPPVWSDYVQVQDRPTVMELAAQLFHKDDGVLPFIADDCFVIGDTKGIFSLVTISTLSVGTDIRYQLALHLFQLNYVTLSHATTFHEIATQYGILAYPDSDLIDRFDIKPNGQNIEEYVLCPERQRPVFIFRSQSLLTGKAREQHRNAQRLHTSFGLVISSNQIHKHLSHCLRDRRLGFIAIPPGSDFSGAKAIEINDYKHLTDCFDFLAETPLIAEPSARLSGERMGMAAARAWRPVAISLPSRSEIDFAAGQLQAGWSIFLKNADLARSQFDAREDVPPLDQPTIPPPDQDVIKPQARVLTLDDEGYPLSISDVPEWVDRTFADRLVMVPRARKALLKSRHPDPGRMARAIAALAGPRRDLVLGDRNARQRFEDDLLRLRMRDTFSNGERLRGQTGAAYIIDHEGRRLILERHLCSNSSGFNDPRLIRIYYAYDRHSQKIVIGWLPTHLPTLIS